MSLTVYPRLTDGTVTSVSVTTANGVSGSVATATTTPAITLTLGAITPTSVNGLTISNSTGTLTVTNGKTVAFSNGITFAGTDSTTMTFPPASASIGYLNIPQNPQSGAYQLALADAGKHIYHALGDGAQAITIPANGTTAFPIGTAITVVNMSATSITVVITTDVLNYVNVGAVTTITIPQYNEVTLLKILTTAWLASGTAGVTTA